MKPPCQALLVIASLATLALASSSGDAVLAARGGNDGAMPASCEAFEFLPDLLHSFVGKSGILFKEEELRDPDPKSERPQGLVAVSLCNRTRQKQRFSATCPGKDPYFVARWSGENCVATYSTIFRMTWIQRAMDEHPYIPVLWLRADRSDGSDVIQIVIGGSMDGVRFYRGSDLTSTFTVLIPTPSVSYPGTTYGRDFINDGWEDESYGRPVSFNTKPHDDHSSSGGEDEDEHDGPGHGGVRKKDVTRILLWIGSAIVFVSLIGLIVYYRVVNRKLRADVDFMKKQDSDPDSRGRSRSTTPQQRLGAAAV